MTTLIYTIAIGDAYRTSAAAMIRSLRDHGYVGEVAVVCDGPVGEGTEHHASQADLADLDMTGRDAVYLRTVADRFIPAFFEHDYILHLDADVRATGPLAFLDDLTIRSTIGVQKYPRPLTTVAMHFTPYDRANVKGHPFAACAGIVGFPGGSFGHDFLRLWQYESAGRMHEEQSALNVVLHRAFPDQHTYLPGCTFFPDQSGCLCHYLGYQSVLNEVGI